MPQRFRKVRAPLLISLLVAALCGSLYLRDTLRGSEWRAYDLRLFLLAETATDPRVVIVGIDDRSLAEIGRWPWPRDVHAHLVDTLAAAGARVIAFDVEFPEPSADPAEDAALAEAARYAGNVILPGHGQLEPSARRGYIRAEYFAAPAEPLASAAEAAHINAVPDQDGVIRQSIPTLAAGERLVPSLAVAAVARFYGVEPPLWDGSSPGLSIGEKTASLDPWGRFLINFSRDEGAFPVVSYTDVLQGNVDPAVFRDRIVLVGPWAAGLGDLQSFPVLGPFTPGVQSHAYTIATMLDGTFIKPASTATNVLVTIFGVFLAGLVFSRLSPFRGAILLVVLLSAYMLVNTYYYLANGVLVDLVRPMLGLALVYVSILGYRVVAEQRERLRVTGMFQRYVSAEVVKEILAAGEDALRLGGIRRPLTVLFLDVRGFTPLAEKLQPEEVVDILNHNFEMITQVIFEYGGTLDKFIGDAAMALFNAPLDLPDHALKAVTAAREIQGRAAGIRAELEARYGRSVHFGIGINTGEAVVGNIGSTTRMEYTAIGDAVNLAARLESNSKPGQILISESTYQALGGRVEAEPVGPLVMKGKSEPVMAYLVSPLELQVAEATAATAN